jgi:hypothetical protein
MARKEKAVGDCFRWAYTYIKKHPNALLQQGLVVAPYPGIEKTPYEHAWVVDKGIVKDWQTMVAGFGGKYRGVGYPEAVWNELWQPEHVRSFNQTDAMVTLARQGHYGPWDGQHKVWG